MRCGNRVMRYRVPVWICLAAIAILTSCPGASSALAITPGGDLSVEFTSPEPALDEMPLVVTVAISNKGDEDLVVDLGYCRESAFSISLAADQGEMLPGSWVLREGIAKPDRVQIPAGGRYVQELIVERWLDVDRITSGTLMIALTTKLYRSGTPPFFEDARPAGIIEVHRELAIKVVEDSKTALELCSALSKKARDGPVEAALSALEILSFVRAEICLPALKEAALHAAAARNKALEGIARVGGHGAVETLLEILEKSDDELRPSVRFHLSSFCREYADIVSPALEAAGGSACANGETLEVSFEVTAKEITLHEPIFLQVTLGNPGRSAVEVDLGVDGVGNYRFALADSEGKRVEAPVLSGEGFHFEDEITLNAGELHEQRLLLDRWLQVEEAGKYLLEAWLSGAVSFAGGHKLKPPGAQYLAFEVLPRSEDRLEKTCRQLAATAIQLRDMEQSMMAAEALSRVADPIAVSGLDKILRNGFLPTQNFAVQGLQRIGDKTAVEALSRGLRLGGTIGREARRALEKLHRRGTDPELLKMIDEALQSTQ